MSMSMRKSVPKPSFFCDRVLCLMVVAVGVVFTAVAQGPGEPYPVE